MAVLVDRRLLSGLGIALVSLGVACGSTTRAAPPNGAHGSDGTGASQPNPDERHPRMLGEWVLVEAGTFTMGTPPGEPRQEDDLHQQRVTLTQDFWITATEVTQAQWRAVMGSNPSSFPSCGDDCPVETVSWLDAVAFVNELSRRDGLQPCYQMTGCEGTPGSGCDLVVEDCDGDYQCADARFAGPSCTGYRLPTEAEWEYAARAGTTSATYNGALLDFPNTCDHQPVLEPIAWYCGNSNVDYDSSFDCYPEGGPETCGFHYIPENPPEGCGSHPLKEGEPLVCGPHPVGRTLPNAWGLHDMLGNVWEWTQGVVPIEDEDAADAEAAPPSPPGEPFRAMRGGGFESSWAAIRAGARVGDFAVRRFAYCGLRVVATRTTPE